MPRECKDLAGRGISMTQTWMTAGPLQTAEC